MWVKTENTHNKQMNKLCAYLKVSHATGEKRKDEQKQKFTDEGWGKNT